MFLLLSNSSGVSRSMSMSEQALEQVRDLVSGQCMMAHIPPSWVGSVSSREHPN